MLSRRTFLKSASLLALAPTAPGFLIRSARAALPDPDGRVLVLVELSGGNDGINTVVPYADEGYARHRRRLRIPRDRLLRVDDRVGLHPALRDAARLLEDGRLAVVQGVGYPNPSRSHFQSMAVWQTARLNPREHDGPGWVGRALDVARRPADRSPDCFFVGLQRTAPALRGRQSVCSALARLDDFSLIGRGVVPNAPQAGVAGDDLRAFIQRSTLDAYATADRLREAAAAPDAGGVYPAGGLSENLRLIARLIKAGFGTRVYYAVQSGYDTHAAQPERHAALLAQLAGGLRAFMEDLAAARLADRVAVLAFSEFGRRVAENDSYGTDHGTAGPVLLAGGGVRAGLVGAAPSLLDLEDGDLRTGIDFRRVYATALENWLGIPSRQSLGGEFQRLPLFRA